MSEDVVSKARNCNSLSYRAFPGGYTGGVSLLKSASTVSLLTLLSRITGLVRELLMAATFGASAMTDAFNVAFRIPNLFRRLFAEGAFSQAFVPVLASTKVQQGDVATRALIDRVATLLAWVLVLVCVVGVVAAPWLVWAMASGLKKDPAGYDAAVLMTRFMFPYIGFMSMVALASGVLNTWRRGSRPGASSRSLPWRWASWSVVFCNWPCRFPRCGISACCRIFLAPWRASGRPGRTPARARSDG